ncbi:cytochrome-c peroxidase [Sphingobacterium sp. SRCM116780]|uniref:cytochrome-c peroxidase n=1 Tax=Sphingobacterium sp. SRCM116780 TaxID=2907623 RepID=UPI001F397862|nr:cytochrome c peroxidase [Sphingobacterium sp. SRCM116780]UIR56040.1 cytochrome-c peroxidase [Sphingobacterium sp. SRCM116780]
MKKLVVFGLLLTLVYACQKSGEVKPEVLKFLGFEKPIHFPEPIYAFESNPITEAGFELGKRLFHDPLLSRNNTIACASCHIQTASFTHHGHDVSHGIDDLVGIRNSIPIMNLAWSKEFFWDGGVFNLDLVSVVPIENPVEMDEKMPNVIKKLQATSHYAELFKKAFGTADITSARLSQALSQFMLMAVSDNSKYDQVMRGEQGVTFTEEEKRGYIFFKDKCSACHTEPLFTDRQMHDNGLGPNLAGDVGRYAITLNPKDKYKFKVPSLRNLAYSAPYMHDGSIYTLSAVLDHYRFQVLPTENLDPILKQSDGTRGITMTEQNKVDLLAFLATLNDASFVKNELLSGPTAVGFNLN